MDFLLTLLASLIGAVVAARLTLWGARSEKWWEKKAATYNDLLSALSAIHRSDLNGLESYQSDRTRSHEENQKLQQEYKAAMRVIDELALIGTFIVSPQVEKDVRELKGARLESWRAYNNNSWSPYDCYEHDAEASEKCIEKVREHAKEDLGLSSPFSSICDTLKKLADNYR